MKRILVCVKMVPTSAVKMDKQHRMDRKGVAHQLNIADSSALEAALHYKDQAEIIILCMGLKSQEDILQELLVRGADRAVLLTDSRMAGSDTFATARVLAEAVKKIGDYDVILCGRKAIDGETGQVPGELAAVLEIPCVTNVNKVEVKEDYLLLERILEEGTAKLETDTPVIVSVCEYSYSLRLPRIRQMRLARDKKVEIWTMADLGITEENCGQKGSLTKVLKVEGIKSGRRKCIKETDPAEGARRLKKMIREALI